MIRNYLFAVLLLIPVPTSASSAVISITDDGFSPAEVTIEQGDVLTFENKGKRPHWPASNIHPTHEIYPEFDPLQEIVPGGTWSIRLEKVGRWNFHDHNEPILSGIVTIERTDGGGEISERTSVDSRTGRVREWVRLAFAKIQYKVFAKSIEEEFSLLNMVEIAQEPTLLRRWLAVLGPKRVMEKLLHDADGGSTVDCHQEAHVIGRLSYELFGAKAFERGNSSSCHAGYQHGVMEALLREEGTEHLSATLSRICTVLKTGLTKFECIHGLGHGVIAYENYDLPKAIETCRSLRGGLQQSSCYGGLFMENILVAEGKGAIPGHQTKWVNDDPYFPCTAVDQASAVQFECYMMQTSWMLNLFQHDFGRVAKACLGAKKDMVPVCFKSLGRDAAGFTLRDPQKTMAICAKVPKVYRDHCIVGALNVIIDFWGSDLQAQAVEFCNHTPTENTDMCFRVLAARLTHVFGQGEQRTAACSRFPRLYQPLCEESMANGSEVLRKF